MSSRKKRGGKKLRVGGRMSEEWLDNRAWSEGKDITWVDRQKVELAIDRFWMRRGRVLGVRGKS